MKKIIQHPASWIAVFAMVAFFWFYHAHPVNQQPSTKSSAEQKDVYYCPMHPTYHSDRPGSCPICHMDLVKLENDTAPTQVETGSGPLVKKEMTLEEAMNMKPGEICLLHKCKHGQCKIVMNADILKSGKCPHCNEDLGIMIKEAMPNGYTSVKLTPDKEQLIGIKTEIAQKRKLSKTLRAVGTVAKDPELYQAQAEYLQALEAYEKAKTGGVPDIESQSKRLVESTRIRLAALGLTPELIQEIESRKEPDRSLLYAQPGLPVWIYARIYEYEIPFVHIGQEVEIQIAAAAVEAGSEQGKVMAIDPSVDPMTRTTRVRIRIDKPVTSFRPDMFTNVLIAADLGEVLSISKEAVIDTGARQIVFVKSSEGKFEPRVIQIGAKTDEDVEIRSGLVEGDQVVVSGNFLIDSESRLKSALQNISETHQHS